MLTCNFNIACNRVVDESRRLKVMSDAILPIGCGGATGAGTVFFTATEGDGSVSDFTDFSSFLMPSFAVEIVSVGTTGCSLFFSLVGDEMEEFDSLAVNLLRK